MKTALKIVIILYTIALLLACSKDGGTTGTAEQQAAQLLTGTGNKVWRLKAIKVNNVQQTLTTYQSQYTKTYTMPAPNSVQGSFTDSDNYFGEWNMKGAVALQETFQQIGGTGFGTRDYSIISLTASTLNVYYVRNNAKVEELYNAY